MPSSLPHNFAPMTGKYWAGLLDAQGKATGDYY